MLKDLKINQKFSYDKLHLQKIKNQNPNLEHHRVIGLAIDEHFKFEVNQFIHASEKYDPFDFIDLIGNVFEIKSKKISSNTFTISENEFNFAKYLFNNNDNITYICFNQINDTEYQLLGFINFNILFNKNKIYKSFYEKGGHFFI
jgi:hypothetical protein